MLKTATPFILAILSNAIAFGQNYPSATEPQSVLTWEEIDSSTPAYPFEAELDACIAKDSRTPHNFGERCIGQLWIYCPEPVVGDKTVRAGTFRFRSCSAYFTRFWQQRLHTAMTGLIAHYDATDVDKPAEDQRSAMLSALQSKWGAWKAAKCRFEIDGVPYHSPWTHTKQASCTLHMTGVRALELEALLRILNL